MKESNLQELKIATDWAYSRVKWAGSRMSNPERYKKAEDRYYKIKTIYENEVNRFIISQMNQIKNVDVKPLDF